MFKDLIEYEDLQEACSDCFGFSGVTFKRDFGPWIKGEKVESLWFQLETATVEEMKDDGTIIKSCKFTLTLA